MLFSKKNRYIFLANPKTGTVATQKAILKVDSTAVLNKIVIDGRNLSFPGYGNSKLLKDILQDELYSYRVFTFVRNPLDKIVSAYHFYKNGKPLVNGNLLNYRKGGVKIFMKAISTFTQIKITKILPFALWSLIRKVKSNEKYLLDEQGEFIVNYIGDTKNISADLQIILPKLGLCPGEGTVRKENASNHKDFSAYFENKWHKYVIDRMYSREMKLYELISSKPADFDYRGRKVDDLLNGHE